MKKVWNTVTWLLVLCVFALAVLLAGVRLIGLTPYTVLSGSMEPAYPVGSMLYVKKIQPEQIQIGDPITFYMSSGGTVATHRVIAIDQENRQFTTKGDANDAADGSPVGFQSLIGKPVFSIPQLGIFSAWVSTPPGLYIALCTAAGIVLLVLLSGLFQKPERKTTAQVKKI